ncbi:MAG: hypothetical protein Q4B28_04100 [bacterium]|nr:hypothetical protein [bacterium]
MKTIIVLITTLIISTIVLLSPTFANQGLKPLPDPNKHLDTILTTSGEMIIPPLSEKGAMRDGTLDIFHHTSGHKINNIISTNEAITDQTSATNKVLDLIKRLINFALGLASLISLIILIRAGIQMLTAAGDDSKFNAGKVALGKVSKALLGIAVSWMIISGIFWLISQIS